MKCSQCEYKRQDQEGYYCELKKLNNFSYRLNEKQSKQIYQCDCWLFTREKRKKERAAKMTQMMFIYSGS